MKKKITRAPVRKIRISKSELARRCAVSRQSIAKYLAAAGAPRSDRAGLFDAVAAAFHVGKCLARATPADNVTNLRERKLALELEALERTAAHERGELVLTSQIAPTIAAFMAQLTDDLRTKFEQELPPKYEGKGTIERQALNAAGVDWVLLKIKAGAAPIVDRPANERDSPH